MRPASVWQPYAPAVLGSERTGPDLSNVGARQASDVWQYLHLYNPRSVVEGSVMPAFPWLFDVKAAAATANRSCRCRIAMRPRSGVVVPNARGRALVAYLLARRQVPIAGLRRSALMLAVVHHRPGATDRPCHAVDSRVLPVHGTPCDGTHPHVARSVLVAVGVIAVVVTTAYTLLYLIRPGETSEDHIKRRILEDGREASR